MSVQDGNSTIPTTAPLTVTDRRKDHSRLGSSDPSDPAVLEATELLLIAFNLRGQGRHVFPTIDPIEGETWTKRSNASYCHSHKPSADDGSRRQSWEKAAHVDRVRRLYELAVGRAVQLGCDCNG